MMGLVPFSQPGRPDRYLARTLADIETRSRLEQAAIDAFAEEQAARTDGIGYVTRRGMINVAVFSKVETALVTMVPMASGRLAAIGDIAAIAIAEVVSDTGRKIR